MMRKNKNALLKQLPGQPLNLAPKFTPIRGTGDTKKLEE